MKYLLLLILLLYLTAAQAEDIAIGRLFFTPAERAALEHARQHPAAKVSNSMPAETEVAVNGYVQRDDGKSTVWVNGRPMRENSTDETLEIGQLQGEHVRIKLPSNGKIVRLKPGQRYVGGMVADVMQDKTH